MDAVGIEPTTCRLRAEGFAFQGFRADEIPEIDVTLKVTPR